MVFIEYDGDVIVIKRDDGGGLIIGGGRNHPKLSFDCPEGQGIELRNLLNRLKINDEIFLFFPERKRENSPVRY